MDAVCAPVFAAAGWLLDKVASPIIQRWVEGRLERYGLFMARGGFDEALRGSSANPRYGLGWWLGLKGAPEDLFYASGSGGQGMYVVRSERTVAVHFGGKPAYDHAAFVKRLFA